MQVGQALVEHALNTLGKESDQSKKITEQSSSYHSKAIYMNVEIPIVCLPLAQSEPRLQRMHLGGISLSELVDSDNKVPRHGCCLT